MNKKSKTRKLILDIATELFLKKRSSHVSLEEVADTAGLARRTLYYHFKNKECLVLAIVEPIFKTGLDYIGTFNDIQGIKIKDICGLCLTLWKKHDKNLDLLNMLDFENFKDVITLHNRFKAAYIELFKKVNDTNIDLRGDIMSIAAIIFRCFVPILMKIHKMPDYEARFINSIYGLIEGISNPALSN
ncbi:TetR/AcrR family transcriptional regulator [Thiospirochaeta perfilievii]|nr:TetR/AcrR family transcriptional regulator [Thiospirochaeta perfilievii]